jgi:protein CLEC16A
MGFTDWLVQVLASDEPSEIESIRKGKPANKYSKENMVYMLKSLRYLRVSSEKSRSYILEILREIVEILLWEDQQKLSPKQSLSQSVVKVTLFDIFLENNTTQYFLQLFDYLIKSDTRHLTELLQILIILFENITNDTSIYYLLSNNYINQIVILGSPVVFQGAFGISPLEEEGLAYYVTLVKTLSLKLNSHTLPFFFNEVSLFLLFNCVAFGEE